MPAHLRALAEKLRSRTTDVGVVEIGYVGLPLMLRFAESGLRTLGLDIDPDKIATLQRGGNCIKTIAGTPESWMHSPSACRRRSARRASLNCVA